jgi:hypothetical protein
MDEEQVVSEYLEEAGTASRRSFLKRSAGTAAALVGLSSGVLLRPGRAAADPPGRGCSCIHMELHSQDCEETGLCCSSGLNGMWVQSWAGYACDNRNTLCWYMVSTLCICCCG